MFEQLINTFGETIVLARGLTVETHVFANLFADAVSLTYEELSRVDQEKGYGYGTYIEQWKEQGLII